MPASRLGVRSRWGASALTLGGLGAIVFSTYRFNDDTLFPGYAALIPTLGTAAIIAAGFVSTTSAGASRVLTLGPVRHVGRGLLLVVPVALAASGLRRRDLGGAVPPRGHRCPRRLLRPSRPHQPPHREALPPLRDAHPLPD